MARLSMTQVSGTRDAMRVDRQSWSVDWLIHQGRAVTETIGVFVDFAGSGFGRLFLVTSVGG